MEITFENFNEFIRNYPNKALDCEHRLRPEHRLVEDYVKIGSLRDYSYNFYCYLGFRTTNENEICLGAYPYNTATVWKCTKCNRITLGNTNDSGWGQRYEVKIDFDKEYIIDPASASVEIERKNIATFANKFGLNDLLNPSQIPFNPNRLSTDYDKTYIDDKTKKYVLDYLEYERKGVEFVSFYIIAPRALLSEILQFQKNTPPHEPPT
jgi:hypothetical protein